MHDVTDTQRIAAIDIDETSLHPRSATARREWNVAIINILQGNRFDPANLPVGPYRLMLRADTMRLQMDILKGGADEERAEEEASAFLASLKLAWQSFRSILRDYQMICESYDEAVKANDPHRIEAIDMGRRGVHNEGSELLQERLAHMVTMDFSTARNFFTLMYVLQMK